MAVLAVAGLALLCLSLLLPNAAIWENVHASVATMGEEGTYPVVGPGEVTLDNFTDARMLATAAYPGQEGVLEQALMGYSERVTGMDPVTSLVELFGDGQATGAQVERLQYARYWQGYLVPLRAGLCLMDYGQLRVANGILQLVLFASLVALLAVRGMAGMILPLALAFLSLCPLSLAMSIQYSTTTYCALAGSLAVVALQRRDGTRAGGTVMAFVAVGALTNYFDLLTFPLVSCGVPLVLYVYARRFETGGLLRDCVLCLLGWGFGYGGMWVAKWLLAAVLMGDVGIIADALSQAAVRSSVNAQINAQAVDPFTFPEVIARNWQMLMGVPLSLPVVVLAFLSLVPAFYAMAHRQASVPIPCLLGIALLPVGWYAAMGNHSYVHAFFTFRELSVTIFALLACAAIALPTCFGAGRLSRGESDDAVLLGDNPGLQQ